jgi:hypothetical protein
MKKILATLISLIVISAVQVNPALASEEGCPNTWNINNSNFSMPQSEYGKFFYGTFEKIITSGARQFSFDNLNWQTVEIGDRYPAPFLDSNVSDLGSKYAQLQDVRTFVLGAGSIGFGEDKIKIPSLRNLENRTIYFKNSINVEKKGCQPFTFTFTAKFDVPKLTNGNFSEKFALIEDKFLNFKAAEDAKKKYQACLEDWKSLSDNKNSVVPIDNRCLLSYQSIKNGNFELTPALNLFPMSENCLSFYAGNSNRSDGYQVTPGSDCQYAVVLSQDWNMLKYWRSQSRETYELDWPKNVYVTDIIRIKNTNIPSSKVDAVLKINKQLVCVKGKLTKKVVAKNPTCPPGYKKK